MPFHRICLIGMHFREICMWQLHWIECWPNKKRWEIRTAAATVHDKESFLRFPSRIIGFCWKTICRWNLSIYVKLRTKMLMDTSCIMRCCWHIFQSSLVDFYKCHIAKHSTIRLKFPIQDQSLPHSFFSFFRSFLWASAADDVDGLHLSQFSLRLAQGAFLPLHCVSDEQFTTHQVLLYTLLQELAL